MEMIQFLIRWSKSTVTLIHTKHSNFFVPIVCVDSRQIYVLKFLMNMRLCMNSFGIRISVLCGFFTFLMNRSLVVLVFIPFFAASKKKCMSRKSFVIKCSVNFVCVVVVVWKKFSGWEWVIVQLTLLLRSIKAFIVLLRLYWIQIMFEHDFGGISRYFLKTAMRSMVAEWKPLYRW